MKHLLLGLIANRAGVIQNQPSLALTSTRAIPLLFQRPNHLLGVMGIHLAAKRLDIESLASPIQYIAHGSAGSIAEFH